MTNILFRIAIVAVLGLVTYLPARAAPTPRHNGTWVVDLVTESGLCDESYRYSLAVKNGSVMLLSGEDDAMVSGKVSPDGSVGLTVSTGGKSGMATGRLKAKTGSGTWMVTSLCTGRWTARKGSDRTARAD